MEQDLYIKWIYTFIPMILFLFKTSVISTYNIMTTNFKLIFVSESTKFIISTSFIGFLFFLGNFLEKIDNNIEASYLFIYYFSFEILLVYFFYCIFNYYNSPQIDKNILGAIFNTILTLLAILFLFVQLVLAHQFI